MHPHAHTNTHILSSSKASSHLFDTVITAHTDSNDGWSPSLGYTFSPFLSFSYLTLPFLAPFLFHCHDILLASTCSFSKGISKIKWYNIITSAFLRKKARLIKTLLLSPLPPQCALAMQLNSSWLNKREMVGVSMWKVKKKKNVGSSKADTHAHTHTHAWVSECVVVWLPVQQQMLAGI